MPENDGLLTADNPAQTADWKEGVAKEIRFSTDGNDKLERFSDATSLATSYLEQEKMNSGRVKMPTEETPDSERSAFFQKMGMPGDVSGYSRPEMPEGKGLDEEFFTDMASIAHQEGVSDKQFSAFVNRVIERQVAAEELSITEDNRVAEETLKQLHTDWGADYDKNLEISRRAIKELVPDDMKEDFAALLAEKNLDNNVLFIRAFNSIGAKMMDDTLVKGSEAKDDEPKYAPKYPESPGMYEFGEDEESVKARAYFTAKGHVYG